MKRIILTLMTFIMPFALSAQQTELPVPSPFSGMEQNAGLTNVTIEYSRPGVKGRTIFGERVPYGVTWSTCAIEIQHSLLVMMF